jgi:hypothetical protein
MRNDLQEGRGLRLVLQAPRPSRRLEDLHQSGFECTSESASATINCNLRVDISSESLVSAT